MERSGTFAHNDFSGGQVNARARRRDDLESVRAGAKVMKNWRHISTGQTALRPGHVAAFAPTGPRTEYVRMGYGREFYLSFTTGRVTIYDATGERVFDFVSSAYLWTDGTVAQIIFAQALNQIFITYPGMRPQILNYDPIALTWTATPFQFLQVAGQSKEPFFRFSIPDESISYSATTGSVTLVTTKGYFDASKIGSVLSIVGAQVTITAITNDFTATAAVGYRLPDAVAINVVDLTPFQVGQVVTAQTQNIKLEVGAIDTVNKLVIGVLMSGLTYQSTWNTSDTLVSPLGSSKFGTTAPALATLPVNTVQWQEEFMSDTRGWPAACFYDRGRVGFCDFPQLQEAILWSEINAFDTFWIDSAAAAQQPAAGALPASAILEFIPDRPRVRHVVGWGDEFVFTDRGIFQIPISAAGNPLKPGSVEFRRFSDDGCSGIRPVTIQDSIMFINAGLNRVSAVRATGSYSRPYVSEDISYEHTDLFNSPVQMTIATGDGDEPERFCHVLNADGTRIVGKVVNNQARVFVGWAPWSSAGTDTWVVAWGPKIIVSSSFFGAPLVMLETASAYLDAAMPINAIPAAFAVSGKGPFWFLPAGTTVTLMNAARDLGDRSIDASGFLIPQGGEDLSDPNLVAGLWWGESRMEVWARNAPEGPSIGQRTTRRNIKKLGALAKYGVGFWLANRFFPADLFGADTSQQPVVQERYNWTRPIGLTWDPTGVLVVDRPGIFELQEINGEVTA